MDIGIDFASFGLLKFFQFAFLFIRRTAMTQVASLPTKQTQSSQQHSYQVLQIPQGIFPQNKNLVDEREHRLFVALDQEKRDFIFPGELKKALTQMGLSN